MPHQLDFRLLGPLEVRDDGRSLALGGRKQRSLLAILLLHANEGTQSVVRRLSLRSDQLAPPLV